MNFASNQGVNPSIFRVNLHTFAPSHPLGVKPSGNALMADCLKKLENQRQRQLGKFGVFPENVLTHLLSFIDNPRDLLSLGHTSRVFYAYTYNEELWRRLYIEEFVSLEENTAEASTQISPFASSKWRGSWRKTVLKVDQEALVKVNDLVFSDHLYRPYQCSQIDFEHLFRKVIEFQVSLKDLGPSWSPTFGVQRLDEMKLTLDEFEKHFIDIPFILQNHSNPKRWPEWSLETLVEGFGSVKFRQEAVKWSLSFYADYFKQNCDESPLYLFDCSSRAIKTLKQEYEAPIIFQNDLFKVFENADTQCRPDHRWLIAGPQGSGSTFHKDPNYTSAWNTVLTGKKLWIMFPPDVKPPGISTDEEEDEVTSPVGVAEWILSGFYNDALTLAQDGKCRIAVTFPGDCIYVPSGWWHSVINLTDSVALTENFVPAPTLPKILLFLKSKRKQLSGFHLHDIMLAATKFLEKRGIFGNQESEDNFMKLENFLSTEMADAIDNRDCGLSEAASELPIFEFFVELLRSSKFEPMLEDALKKMKALESEEAKKRHKQVKVSDRWTSLAADSNNGFSFSLSLE
ncbi:LADA_0H16248g1_1 [Lachancea dasiensis]|uniref:LADA_0H16248g1_1 n=1 Tax=Lachancea dasiensis TaxID=1072105 RepID=A0A1G4K551_9SACH|nr:LADA_0H16248g1_1 [Lachancea dasiensis]